MNNNKLNFYPPTNTQMVIFSRNCLVGLTVYGIPVIVK